MKVIDCAQMRELERQAVEAGCSYLQLMEQAGMAVAQYVRFLWREQAKTQVLILCGKGNNGGDGFVAARYLQQWGIKVAVLLADGRPTTGDAQIMLERLDPELTPIFTLEDPQASQWLEQSKILVDAVYGIGFHGKVKEPIVGLFERVNQSAARVVAVDLPSGAQGDSGRVEGVCIQADATITFTALKPAHILYPASDFCGQVEICQVGVPGAFLTQAPSVAEVIDDSQVKACFAPRRLSAHKGSFGTLTCLCGSVGMAGAAVLSTSAALRCGVGLVRLVTVEPIYSIVAGYLREPVFSLFPAGKKGTLSAQDSAPVVKLVQASSACLAGCGMGNNADTQSLVCALLQQTQTPLVLDADGLNALAAHINILKNEKQTHRPIILTPHPGEMARLANTTIQWVQENRLECAMRFAKDYGVIVVLKGANTLIASPDGRIFVNRTGNPGMARGGSGDVLAGMIASFLGSGIPAFEAAMCGVYLHGRAGDRCAQRLTQTAMLPSDMVAELPQVFGALLG